MITSAHTTLSRREFQRLSVGAVASTAAAAHAAAAQGEASRVAPRGKAQACILLWMGGGMCHIDTLDPKSVGDPPSNKAGSAYRSIPTAIPGVKVCEHLLRTANLLDRGVILRTLTHPLKVDHADSTGFVKTGRLTSGTVVYPSLGSLVTHQRGRRAEGIPPYIVMGYPNVTRGPGFLGGEYGYLYLTDPEAGPTGLRRPFDVTAERQRRRSDLLSLFRRAAEKDLPDATPLAGVV